MAHAQANARPRTPTHTRLADARAHVHARVRAGTRARSARHAVGMTHENVGISAPDSPRQAPSAPLAVGVTAGDARPQPPRSGPRERLATDLHGGSRPKRDASAENGTLAEFLGVSQYPCRTPGGDRAVAGRRAPGRWLSDGHTSSHPAASAHPHTPLYARAR